MGKTVSVATHQLLYRYLVAVLIEEAAAIKDLLDRPGDGGNFGIMEHRLVPAVHAAAYQALVPCHFAQVSHCLGDIAAPRGQRQAAHGGGDPLVLAGELTGGKEELHRTLNDHTLAIEYPLYRHERHQQVDLLAAFGTNVGDLLRHRFQRPFRARGDAYRQRVFISQWRRLLHLFLDAIRNNLGLDLDGHQWAPPKNC